jgi:amino acid permease
MFRSQTPADILEGPYEQSATSIFVARLVNALVAILRVPVNHHTGRSSVYTLWESFSRKQPLTSEPTEPTRCFLMVEVVTFAVLMVVLAMHIRSLAVALDIMSAACAMPVMFWMPGLFFLLKGQSHSLGWRVLAYVFMAIGVVLAAVSIGDVFKET